MIVTKEEAEKKWCCKAGAIKQFCCTEQCMAWTIVDDGLRLVRLTYTTEADMEIVERHIIDGYRMRGVYCWSGNVFEKKVLEETGTCGLAYFNVVAEVSP